MISESVNNSTLRLKPDIRIHTISASEVAPVGDANSKVPDHTPIGIDQLVAIASDKVVINSAQDRGIEHAHMMAR